VSKYVNELTIRTVGPALILILEYEAPLRFESVASTDQEHERLRVWSLHDERTREIMRAYFDCEDELERSDAHAARLADATPPLLGERVFG
jgi:hypothetical protein